MLKAIQQDASRLAYTASQQAAFDHMIQDFHEAREAHTEATAPTGTFRREGPKIGRNEICPCGSGLKYKRCCGSAVTAPAGGRHARPSRLKLYVLTRFGEHGKV